MIQKKKNKEFKRCNKIIQNNNKLKKNKPRKIYNLKPKQTKVKWFLTTNKRETLVKRKRKKRRKSQKMKKNYVFIKNRNVCVNWSMKNSVDYRKKQSMKSNVSSNLKQNKPVSDNNKKLKKQSENYRKSKKDKLNQKQKKLNLKSLLGCRRRKRREKKRNVWNLKDKCRLKKIKSQKNNKWRKKNTADDNKKKKKSKTKKKTMSTFQTMLQNIINQESFHKPL